MLGSLDDFATNFEQFIHTVTLEEFVATLRKLIPWDIRRLGKILLANKNKIVELYRRRLKATKLHVIGEFLYTICNICEDLCKELSQIWSESQQVLLELIDKSSLSELGAFIPGAILANVEDTIIRKCMDRSREIIKDSNLPEICDFFAHLGMIDASILADIIRPIWREIESLFLEYLVRGPSLDLLITMIGYLSKIDRTSTRTLLAKNREKIQNRFTQDLNNMSLDQVTSFLLILAQVDKEFAQSLINNTIESLKEKYKDEISTLLMFIDRIQT